MNIINFLVLSAFVLIPYIGFMAIIAVITYNSKLKSAMKFFDGQKSIRPHDQTKSKLPTNLKIYILIMVMALGFLICLIMVTAVNYLFGIPQLSSVDNLLFGKIFMVVFVIQTIGVIVVSILLYRRQ